MIEIKEEHYALGLVHDLSSKSFEHYYASSSYSDRIKDQYRNYFSVPQLRNHLTKGGCTRFCAVENNAYIGTIDIFRDERLRRLYIDPDREGEGIATMLIDQSILYLQNKGITTVAAYAGDNGITFWENKGFTLIPAQAKGIYHYMEKQI